MNFPLLIDDYYGESYMFCQLKPFPDREVWELYTRPEPKLHSGAYSCNILIIYLKSVFDFVGTNVSANYISLIRHGFHVLPVDPHSPCASLGCLYWWQRQVTPILGDGYPDCY